MTGKELFKMFKEGKKLTIRFTEGIEECEGMFSKNMIADISSIHLNDEYLVLRVDYSKYYEYNKQFDIHNWFNKETGNYDLSYEEYEKQYGRTINMIQEVWDNYEGELYNCKVVEDKTISLYNEYISLNSGETYVEWLEGKVLESEKAIK